MCIQWRVMYIRHFMQSITKQQKNSAGFTLMEILIAMTIMGILASVGYAAYTVSLQKSRDAARKSDLTQVARALEAFNNDTGVYPRSCSNRIAGCVDGTEQCVWGSVFSVDDRVYMRQLPLESKSGWTYVYLASADQKSYQLFARIENEEDPHWIEYSTTCTGTGLACTYGVSSANVSLEPGLSTEVCN